MKDLFHSLSFKIALKFALILALIFLVCTIVFTLIADGNITKKLYAEIGESSKILSSIAEEKGTRRFFYNNIELEFPEHIRFNVYDADTHKIIATNETALIFLPLSDDIKELEAPYSPDGKRSTFIYKAVKITSCDNRDIVIQVSIDNTMNNHNLLLRVLPNTVVEAILPICLLTFFIALSVSQSALKPVSDLTKAAQTLSTTTLDKLLPESGTKDELDTLAITFNSLFRKIKKDFDKEKQFTSDVSHELKTPVAVILGQANLIRRWGKDDKEQLEKSISSIIKETKSMEAIITNLLQISRIENGKITPFIEEINIQAMFNRIKDECASWSKDTVIKFDTEASMTLKTDRELFHQVLTIIVSNSIKFSPEGCIIDIDCTHKPDITSITIKDNGPGFSSKDIDHVFERFYRGDDSHNRNAGGSGLGLSIAKVIMQSLNGDISASNAQDDLGDIKGAVLTLNFMTA